MIACGLSMIVIAILILITTRRRAAVGASLSIPSLFGSLQSTQHVSSPPPLHRSLGVPHFPASLFHFSPVSTPHNRRCSATRITSARSLDRSSRRHRRGVVLDVAGQRYSFHTSRRRWHPQFTHCASFPELYPSSASYVARCSRSITDIMLPGIYSPCVSSLLHCSELQPTSLWTWPCQ